MIVVFALPSGPQIRIECNINETINSILPRIIVQFHLQNYNNIYFIYQGKKLRENDDIRTINYLKDTIIFVCVDNQEQNIIQPNPFHNFNFSNEHRYLEISFALTSGRNIVIKCKPKETIKDILSTIKNDLKINNCSQIKFIYKGKVLNIEEKIENIDYIKGQNILVDANS